MATRPVAARAMPELPEVEFARRCLARWTKSRRIVRAEAAASRVLGKTAPSAFAATLKGARVTATERRGKNLVATIARANGGGEAGLYVHLGMTGKLVRRKQGEDPPRFSRAHLALDDGSTVHYCDMRLFGHLELGPLAKIRARAFDGLGPDPLAEKVDARALAGRLMRRKGPLKPVLMDQTVLAGLGNIHAVEALWRAKLSPFASANELTRPELTRLAKAIKDTITFALKVESGPEIVYVEEPGSDNPFKVYGRPNQPCARCRRPIRRAVQAGRSTFWCPACQP